MTKKKKKSHPHDSATSIDKDVIAVESAWKLVSEQGEDKNVRVNSH